MAKARWISILGGAVLFAVGWFVGRQGTPVPAVAPTPPLAKSTAVNAPEVSEAPLKVAPTKAAQVETAPVDFTSDDAVALVENLGGFERVKFGLWLARHGDMAGRFDLFEPGRLGRSSYLLNPKLQETFELSNAGMNQLQQAIDHARAEVSRIEQTLAQTGWDEKHEKWVIDVPSYPAQGGEVFDELHEALGAVLGAEKLPSFLDLHSRSIDRQFDQLGTKERRFLVERSTAGGKPTLTIKEEWKSDNGSGNNTSQLQLQDAAAKLGDLTRLLPPEFGVEPPPTDG